MTKKEKNIAISRDAAKKKITALEAVNEQLEAKQKAISAQIKANGEKIEKIKYYLQQLENSNRKDSADQ